jgi:hypothetical protein
MCRFPKQLVIIMIAALFPLAGCVSCVQTAAPTQAAQMASASPTVTSAPSPTATPSPPPAQSAIAAASAQADEELDKQIKAFLNKESPYRAEDIQKGLIGRQWVSGDEYGDVTKGLKLGLVLSNSDTTMVGIEGILLDYRKKDNSVLIVVGFDGKNGKRFVTPFEISTYVYENVAEAKFNFFRLKAGTVDLSQYIESTDGSTENVLKYLEKIKGNVLVLNLDTTDMAKDMMNDYSGVALDYLKEAHRKVDYARKAVDEVDSNNLGTPDGVKEMTGDVNLIKIDSAESIDYIDLENVPIIFTGIGIHPSIK